MVGIVYRVGVIAKLIVAIMPTEVEDLLVGMVLNLIEVVVRVMIRLILILFYLILKHT